MINDLTSPVERGPIIDVSQQGVNLSRASPLTGSGSGEGLVSGGCSMIDHSMPEFVVALEGDGGKDQLESLTMCVDMSTDIP